MKQKNTRLKAAISGLLLMALPLISHAQTVTVGKHDLRRPPYGLFRIKVGARPVLLKP